MVGFPCPLYSVNWHPTPTIDLCVVSSSITGVESWVVMMGVNGNANRYNMLHRIHVYVQHTRGARPATWIADLVEIGAASVVNILPEFCILCIVFGYSHHTLTNTFGVWTPGKSGIN